MKFFSIAIIILGLSSTSRSQAQVQAAKQSPPVKTYLMAAMGDSITAAFLAATDLSWFNSRGNYQSEINAFMNNLEQNFGKNPETINFAGDMAHVFESRTTLSWATGQSIPSHYMLVKAKIQSTEKVNVDAYNIAISGGVTSDLLTEADSIVNQMSSGHYAAIKYVTLLIGSNDICHGLDQQTMKNNIHEAFRRLSLIKQSEPIRVLMSGIPNLPDVASPAIRSSNTIFDMSCQDLRQYVTFTCPSMANWITTSEYNALVQQVQGVNELLYGAAVDANASFSSLSVAFSNRLFEAPLAPTDLAVDCFHPNANTQIRISQELWNDQPWYH